MNITRTDWPRVALLWLTGLLAAAQFAKLTLTIDAAAVVWPGQPIAWLVSGVAVIGIMCGAFAGFVVARIGVRRAILICIAISIAMSLIQGIAMPFWAFMATRIIEGVGHLGLVIALPTMMAASAAPQTRTIVMGIWATFFGVGYALAALIVQPVIAWGGMQAVYVGHGALLALLWPVLWASLPRIVKPGAVIPPLRQLHGQIYRRATLLAPALGHGIYTSLFIALVAFLPPALDALWLTPLLPLANLSGTFAAGFIAKRIAPGRIVTGGFIASALLFAAVGISHAPLLAIIAMCATGLVAGANFAAVPVLNPDSRDQALANGAMAQIGNIGTFTGTPLIAITGAAFGFWGVVGVAMAICVLGAVVAGQAYRVASR